MVLYVATGTNGRYSRNNKYGAVSATGRYTTPVIKIEKIEINIAVFMKPINKEECYT